MNGLWCDPGVPKRGWELFDVMDMGAPDDICEMCQVQAIRYVHYVRHPDYYDLHVGCVCASNMLGNSETPRQVEKKLRQKAQRKTNWPNLKWKISARGNEYIRKDDIIVVVYGGQGGWSFSVDGERSSEWFNTEVDAKLASFEKYWEQSMGSLFPASKPIEYQPSSSIDWVLNRGD